MNVGAVWVKKRLTLAYRPNEDVTYRRGSASLAGRYLLGNTVGSHEAIAHAALALDADT